MDSDYSGRDVVPGCFDLLGRWYDMDELRVQRIQLKMEGAKMVMATHDSQQPNQYEITQWFCRVQGYMEKWQGLPIDNHSIFLFWHSIRTYGIDLPPVDLLHLVEHTDLRYGEWKTSAFGPGIRESLVAVLPSLVSKYSDEAMEDEEVEGDGEKEMEKERRKEEQVRLQKAMDRLLRRIPVTPIPHLQHTRDGHGRDLLSVGCWGTNISSRDE